MKKEPMQTWVDIHSVEDLNQLTGHYDSLALAFEDACSLDLTDCQFNIYANVVKFVGPVVASDTLKSSITIRPDTFRIYTAGERAKVVFESMCVMITKDINDLTPPIVFTEMDFNACVIAFQWRNGLNIGSSNTIRFRDCKFNNTGYLNCQYNNSQIFFDGCTVLVKKKLIHIDEDATNIKIDMNDMHITFKELENESSHCISLDAVTMNTSCSNCAVAMYSVRYHKSDTAPKLLANIINYYGDAVNGVNVDIRTVLDTTGAYPDIQQRVAYLSIHILTQDAPYELIRALNVSCKVALEQLDNN